MSTVSTGIIRLLRLFSIIEVFGILYGNAHRERKRTLEALSAAEEELKNRRTEEKDERRKAERNMKFSITRMKFAEGLKGVQSIVGAKAPLQIMQNVLLEAVDGKLRFTASDLDLSMFTELDAVVEEPGKTTLPAKVLFSVVSCCPEGYVLYYTNQCPFNAKYVPVLEETAARAGIPFRAVRLDSREAARNAPTPVTNYALFHDGEYLTNEQMNDRKFLKMING